MASRAVGHAIAESTGAPYRLAEILAGLSLAEDLGVGHPVEHILRACFVGMHVAEEMHLLPAQRAELYYTQLLMHSGCTADAADYAALIMGNELTARADFALTDPNSLPDMLGWMWRNVAPDAPLLARLQRIAVVLGRGPGSFLTGLRAICEVGARIAGRLGLPEPVQDALFNLWESWNGKGPRGLRGEAIPLYARIAMTAFLVDSFAGARGPAAAERAVLAERGKTLDPAVVDAFMAAAKRLDFWSFLDSVDLWSMVLDLEPDSPYRFVGEEQLDTITCAFADFTDLKSPTLTGHSQGTADLAEAIARQMRLPGREIADIRRAGMLHDLGNVAVPVRLLATRGKLATAEEERLRLHPYYSERILTRVPAFARVAAIAGAHHERVDGRGYYRGLAGDAIPLGAQILAVADRYEELSSEQLGEGVASAEASASALALMLQETGTRLAVLPFDALVQELGGRVGKPLRRPELPAGLTGREMEVLALVARGASNREIAHRLVISEKTAGHHLEHIYNKIGVSNRAAAVFYAMQHRLIP